jgi:catenin alpha
MKLDSEVEKWDENGNDIIVIDKKMCMIMMEMKELNRGSGNLKKKMDVINEEKKI